MPKSFWVFGLVTVAAVAGACAAKDTDPGSRLGYELTGSDFSAWRANTGQWRIVGGAHLNPGDEKLLLGEPATGAIVNGPTGRTVNLLSKQEFGDVRAHVEFMVSKDSNSGVYFMGRYELQIFDSWQKAPEYPGIECGGIYERWDEKRSPKGFEGRSPRVNASRRPGQWQTFDVVFRAPRFDKAGHKIANARFEKVVHNGILVHSDVVLTGPTRSSAYEDEKPTGPLMLQGDHGPVAYRNIRLAPAGPNPFFAMDTATKDANHQTAQQQAQMLAELGYVGISLGYENIESLTQMLRAFDQRNLQLFALYVGIDIDPLTPPYHPTVPEAIEALGGRNTVLWLFVKNQQRRPPTPEDNARSVEIAGDLAEAAAVHGLRVALYPHHDFWLETVEHAVRIAETVNRPNVGVAFNLCHWLRTDRSRDAKSVVERAMPHLFTVTINGADTDGQDWNTLIQTLDRGSFDVRGFLEMLRDAGYTGPIGFQGYGIGGDAYQNLERSMTAWNKLSEVFAGDTAPR